MEWLSWEDRNRVHPWAFQCFSGTNLQPWYTMVFRFRFSQKNRSSLKHPEKAPMGSVGTAGMMLHRKKIAHLPSSKLTQTLPNRGWKISFHYKLVILRVYVNLPDGNRCLKQVIILCCSLPIQLQWFQPCHTTVQQPKKGQETNRPKNDAAKVNYKYPPVN